MILVVGASGTIGRAVVASLLSLGQRVRALSRVPSRVPTADGQVEVVQGDLHDRSSLRRAVEGVSGVFTLCTGPDPVDQDRSMAQALSSQPAIGKVVKLSSIAARPPVVDAYAQAHTEGEKAFLRAVPDCTILRPAAFMSNALYWARSIREAGVAYGTFGMIPRAVVHPQDVAAVAAVALTMPGHSGATYEVTGPEALTAPEQVRRIGVALRKSLRFVETPPAAARAAMEANGIPAALAAGMVASQGDFDPARGGRPVETVQRLTGRPPWSFDAWLAGALDAFR